jgi:bile acid:Na+ symporter, BASS family
MESNIVISLVGPIVLGIIMMGTGMSLTTDDFKRVLIYPKGVCLGTVLQMVALPVVGFLLASLFSCPPAIAVGIILLAACPGGVASNIITHLSKGDTALAVTLTVISSFLTVLTIPLIVSLAQRHFMGADMGAPLPVLETSVKVFLIVVPPVLIGMYIRHIAPAFADRSERFVKTLSLLFLVFLIVAVAMKERHNIVAMFAQAGIIGIVLCLSTAGFGYFCARIFGLELEQRISITVGVGFQNSGLALVIATSFLSNTQIAVPAAIYTIVMYLTSAALIAYVNVHGKRQSLRKRKQSKAPLN